MMDSLLLVNGVSNGNDEVVEDLRKESLNGGLSLFNGRDRKRFSYSSDESSFEGDSALEETSDSEETDEEFILDPLHEVLQLEEDKTVNERSGQSSLVDGTVDNTLSERDSLKDDGVPHSEVINEHVSEDLSKEHQEEKPKVTKRKRRRKAATEDDGVEVPPETKKKRERKKKAKSERKKAFQRRNIKRSKLKDLKPETSLAQNEEIERMKRIGLFGGLEGGNDDLADSLPESVVTLLNAADMPTKGKTPSLQPTVGVANISESVPFPTSVQPTLGEPSTGTEDRIERGRDHTEALPPNLGSSTKQEIVILSDEEDLAKPGKDLQVEGQGSKSSLSVRQKYLGLDIKEKGPVSDPKEVILNPGHAADEEDVHLATQVALTAKPHQIGGMRFLYDNIIESQKRYSKVDGFGCILAHSMGLGKTLQAIGFVEVFFRCTPAKHVLIIVPVNTLMNWIAEFNHWLPKAGSPAAQEGGPIPVEPRPFKLFYLSDAAKTMETRVGIIGEWREEGGVLLIGYEMYRLLAMSVPSIAGNKMAVKKKQKKKKFQPENSNVIDLDKTEKEMEGLIGIQEALCRPGPDLVICDEGHRIKNEATNISIALKQIATRRRIILTGYPLQNNLMEYWCMVDFVRPNYLGDKKEFKALFENPINNGLCNDSVEKDVQLMKHRSHVLTTLLSGFVLRCDHRILKQSLPNKYEHVLYVTPSEVQKQLYDHTRESLSSNPIVCFTFLTRVWNHPDLFYDAANSSRENELSATIQDLDEPLPSRMKQDVRVSVKWPEVENYKEMNIENSTKFLFLMGMLDLSVALGDKMLVFSQSLSTLSLIEKFLAIRPIPIPALSQNGTIQYTSETWKKGRTYYRLDGGTAMTDRENMIKKFNSPQGKAWLFLLSTRAGSLGINLVAANRVVVMDVAWNPCHDAQAVCRVYRYGQEKPCHIYRLVMDGTMEKKMYQKQILKQGMSDRVVDELNPERNMAKYDIEGWQDPVEIVPEEIDPSSVVSKFRFDPVLMSVSYQFHHLLSKIPFEHESLLIDSQDQLTDNEKQQAMQDFQFERERTRKGFSLPAPSNYMATPGTSGHPSQQQPSPPKQLSYSEAMAELASKQRTNGFNLASFKEPMFPPAGQPVSMGNSSYPQQIAPPIPQSVAPHPLSTSQNPLWKQRSYDNVRPFPGARTHQTNYSNNHSYTGSFTSLPAPERPDTSLYRPTPDPSFPWVNSHSQSPAPAANHSSQGTSSDYSDFVNLLDLDVDDTFNPLPERDNSTSQNGQTQSPSISDIVQSLYAST